MNDQFIENIQNYLENDDFLRNTNKIIEELKLIKINQLTPKVKHFMITKMLPLTLREIEKCEKEKVNLKKKIEITNQKIHKINKS
jgi:chemotaxis protein CheY-P-specific phosphatase CheC